MYERLRYGRRDNVDLAESEREGERGRGCLVFVRTDHESCDEAFCVEVFLRQSEGGEGERVREREGGGRGGE